MSFQGTTRVVNTIFRSSNVFTSLLRPQVPVILSSATICSKELRDPDYQRAKPWPYETKKYNIFWWYLDSTTKRFDENSKIVVVDGNIGAGKTALAKKLAEQFDMKYVPEPSMDRFYVTAYGHDLRLLDPIMPPSFKSCDIKTFYENPKHRNVALLQMKMFMLRYIDYINALQHLLNTGQGIVMDRSVYSDFVFMETMCEMGYVRRQARDHYFKVFQNCVEELLRPHLIIYLDITPEVALQRIKQRNDPAEVNSKVLTKEYLECIDNYYKNKHLDGIRSHTEVMTFDWNNYGDVEVVIDDIERIDLDKMDEYSDRLQDWNQESDWEWGTKRYKYSNRMTELLNYAHVVPFGVPELTHPTEEVMEYRKIMEKVPGMKYAEGFNIDMGDNVVFKTHNAGYRDKVDYFPLLDR